MAFDEGLAERLREHYAAVCGVEEKKMFGGLAFMVNGHMSCGVNDEVLMVRLGAERYSEALEQPHARPMDFTGKPLKGFVFVDPPGIESDADLAAWVRRSLAFVHTLPPK